MIYFLIEQSDYRAVKIGYTANLAMRLSNLQIGNVKPLVLVAIIDGNQLMETILHKLFEKYHVRGEWYSLTGDLLNFIKPHLLVQVSKTILDTPLLSESQTKFKTTKSKRNKVYTDNIYKSDKEIALAIHKLEPDQQLYNLINWVRRKRGKN